MQVQSGEDVEYSVAVTSETAGGRLDAVLAQGLQDTSRSRIKQLILSGAVSIGGATILEPRHRVKAGDMLVLIAPELIEADPQPEAIPLAVLYEDDQVIVIDKPKGMVVHPAPGSPTGTLVNALLHHCGRSLTGIGGERRPGIVHRLDKDTTGVMVVAKTEQALNHLAAQFADHGRTGPLHRAYLGFVWGLTESARGSVDAPLGRDANNRLKQAVRRDGRRAITHYTSEARYLGDGWAVTRLRLELETGRTHQIRVHMAHIGHPLLGDALYAPGFATKIKRLPPTIAAALTTLGRQALHAAELGFTHPASGKEMHFSAPLPPDLQALQQALQPFDQAVTR